MPQSWVHSDLSAENPNLIQIVNQWVSKLKAYYKGKTISEEGAAVAQLESFEKIQKLFMEAMEDAGKNFAAAEVTNEKSTTPEGDARYSLKDIKVPSRSELDKKPPITVVDISSAQTTGRFSERRKKILEKAATIIAKPYLNKDTNTLIFLTNKSYTHAFNNIGEIQLNAVEHLPELVENAVLTHSEQPTHGSEYTDGVYTFFAAAKASRIMPVKIKVKEYNYVGQMLPQNIRDYFSNNPKDYAMSYDTVVLEVEEIEESPSGSARDTTKYDVSPSPEELYTISVTELLDLVKGDAEKYIPKDEKKSIRNEEVDNSPRGILMRMDAKSRKLDAEKYHLGRYQERVEKLAEQEAGLKNVNVKIQELQSEARNAQPPPFRVHSSDVQKKQIPEWVSVK